MIEEIIKLLNGLIDLARNAASETKNKVFQSCLTCIMLIFFYAMSNIIHEGSIVVGLKAAFLESRVDTAIRLNQEHSALLQTEIRQAAIADRLVKEYMESLLYVLKTPARIRVGLVHNGIANTAGRSMMRIDAPYSVTALGRSQGATVVNQPFSDWSDYSEAMFKEECVTLHTSSIRNPAQLSRLLSAGIEVFIVCPIIDIQGSMIGGLFVSWDRGDLIPDLLMADKMVVDIRATAGKLAGIFSFSQRSSQR